MIQKLKWSVVKLEVAASIGLDNDYPGSGTGTGFIVDKELGIVVTNRHVVSKSPLTQLKVGFFNSKSVTGKVIYVDPWHDFAFVQFDPEDKVIDFELSEVELGSQADIKTGDELLLIGHSSGADYSVKKGTVNKKFVRVMSDTHDRHTHHIHMSLARAGGASGSPLWNEEGKVVGLHSNGNDNESYEVRIDYIKDALTQIKNGMLPRRGDLFLTLGAMKLFEAYEGYDLPEKYILEGMKENDSFHYALFIDKLIKGTEAYQKLQVGDIVVGIRGKSEKETSKIGYSLYEFDKLVDENVGGAVVLNVYRQNTNEGRPFEVELHVEDANQYMPYRFAVLSGAVFHDVTPSLSFTYNWPLSGVFLNSSDVGGAFSLLGDGLSLKGNPTNERAVVIKKIDGIDIPNLDAFLQIMKDVNDGDVINVVKCNSQSYFVGNRCEMVTISIITDPLRVFSKNPATFVWEEEELY